MRKEKLKISLERVVQSAKTQALEQGGHPPTVMVEGSKETIAIPIAQLEDSHGERVNQMYELGFLLASFAIVGVLKQVFFISESWMTISQDGKQPEVRPSQNPQRIEVLQVSQLTVRDKVARMVLLEIKRKQDGIVYTLENADSELTDSKTQVKAPLLEAFTIGFLGFIQKKINLEAVREV